MISSGVLSLSRSTFIIFSSDFSRLVSADIFGIGLPEQNNGNDWNTFQRFIKNDTTLNNINFLLAKIINISCYKKGFTVTFTWKREIPLAFRCSRCHSLLSFIMSRQPAKEFLWRCTEKKSYYWLFFIEVILCIKISNLRF